MTLHTHGDTSKLWRVLETTRLVEGRFELRDLLRQVVAEACSMTGARYGALGVLDVTGDGLAEFITVGRTGANALRSGSPPIGQDQLGIPAGQPAPWVLHRVACHSDHSTFPPGDPPTDSLLGVPVRVRGEVYGNLCLADKADARPFDVEDRELVEALALAAGIGIETARLHAALVLVAELRTDAREDHLTGLANRRSWDERLEDELKRSSRSGAPISVALLDLDGFKAVNDRGGHQAGDSVLQEFAKSWLRVVRHGGDFVARLGGDEFGLLAPGSTSSGVRTMAHRHSRNETGGPAYSLGVATWDGAETAGQLMHRADLSMYRSKARNHPF